MTLGMRAAFALYFIIGGSIGFERYMSVGQFDHAVFDAALTIVGIVWLARQIDDATKRIYRRVRRARTATLIEFWTSTSDQRFDEAAARAVEGERGSD